MVAEVLTSVTIFKGKSCMVGSVKLDKPKAFRRTSVYVSQYINRGHVSKLLLNIKPVKLSFI